MVELYWFTRLDAINNMFFTVLFISITCLVASIFWFFIVKNAEPSACEGESAKQSYLNTLITIKKIIKKISVAVIISAIFTTFIPTKQDALLIYGVGGILDYAQSNEKIKQLPDKAVDALNIIIDNYTEDLKQDKKQNKENNN